MKPVVPNPSDDDAPPLSPDEEAAMQAEIDLALEPYRRIAPAALIPTLRESLERSLRTHPYPRQLLRAFAPRTPVVASGEGPLAGSEERVDKTRGKGGA